MNPGDRNSTEKTFSRGYLVELLQILKKRFDESGLRDLCFSLKIDYDDLTTGGKADKARELIRYLERHNRIPELLAAIKRSRPDISLPAEEISSSPSPDLEQLPPVYDVFLSYDIEDKDIAEQVARELQSSGLRVSWELNPTLNWLEGLIEGISRSKSMVMLIGASGTGNWVNEDVEPVLREYAEAKHVIIPFVLPEGKRHSELPPFLKQRRMIDRCTGQISHSSFDKLIWGITGRKPTTSISQIGSEFLLRLDRTNQYAGRQIQAYTLPNPGTGLLYLTWETFGAGIEILRDQVRNLGFRLDIDACFGINDAGLVMATYLSSSAFSGAKIGYIRHRWTTEGRTIVKDASFFPELPPGPIILLTDFEVKTGSALKTVVDEIHKKYPESKIYFAAFGAMTESTGLKIKTFNELKAASNMAKLDMEDYFIAFTMHPPGIEPPLELR